MTFTGFLLINFNIKSAPKPKNTASCILEVTSNDFAKICCGEIF